jgi:hypothetical protein
VCLQITCVGGIRFIADEEEHQNSLQEEFNDCAGTMTSKLQLLKNSIAEVGMKHTRNCLSTCIRPHILKMLSRKCFFWSLK